MNIGKIVISIIILLIILIVFNYIFIKFSNGILNGGVGSDWQKPYVHNNLYLLLFYDETKKEYIVFAKFGIKSENTDIQPCFSEFFDHKPNFTNPDKSYSPVYKCFNSCRLVAYCVYDIPKLDFHSYNKKQKFILGNKIKGINNILIIHDLLDEVYNSYGFNIRKLWKDSITANELNHLKSVNFVENLSTALLESFGHLACSDVLRAYLLNIDPTRLFDQTKFFHCSDSCSSKEMQKSFHGLYVGYSYTSEKWAFSNDEEFVCAVFPETMNLNINSLNIMANQITILSCQYLLQFINRYYNPIEIIGPNENLVGEYKISLIEADNILNEDADHTIGFINVYLKHSDEINDRNDFLNYLPNFDYINTIASTQNNEISEYNRLSNNTKLIKFSE